MRILCRQFYQKFHLTWLLLGVTPLAFAQTPMTSSERAGQLMQQLQNDPALRSVVPAQSLPKLQPQATPAPPDVEPKPGELSFELKSIQLEGNTLISSARIQVLLAPWQGKTLTLAQLEQAVAQISALYRQQGWLAQALLPDQDVSEGHVRIAIIEGQLGRVIVNMQADQRQLGEVVRRRIEGMVKHRMQLGQPIAFDNMDWALLVAGDLPGVSVAGSLQAGQLPGTSDLLIRVESRNLLLGSVSTDNQGSRSTGIVRVNGQLQINSPFGLGEQFSFAGSKNKGSTYVRAAFSTPIGIEEWRGLTFNAEVSRMDYRTLEKYIPDGARVRPEGFSNVYGLHVVAPLVRSANTNLNMDLGLEYRRADDYNDTNSSVPGTLSLAKKTQSHNHTLGLNFSHLDGVLGGGNNVVSLLHTRGSLGLGGPASVLTNDADTAQTQGVFEKQKLTISRLQFMDGKHSLFMSASKQWASKNLDSSEKLYLGGSSGVRAFPGSEAGGSIGVTATVELRRDWNAQWQTALFYDYGRVSQFKVPFNANGAPMFTGDQSNELMLHGRGFSVTYRHASGAELKTTVSRRVSPNPQPTSAGTDNDGTLRLNRVWFSVSLPF